MKNRKPVILIVSLLLFVAAFYAEKLLDQKSRNFQHSADKANKELQLLEKTSIQHVREIASRFASGNNLHENDNTEWPSRAKDPWMSVFVFQNDSIIWWSDNSVLPDKSIITPGFRYLRMVGMNSWLLIQPGTMWLACSN